MALAVLAFPISACGATIDGDQWRSVSIRNDTQAAVHVKKASKALGQIAPNQSLVINVDVSRPATGETR